jgi:hypothetical protein
MNAHQSMVANNSIILVNAFGGAPIANKVLRTGWNFVPVTRLNIKFYIYIYILMFKLSHTYFPPTQGTPFLESGGTSPCNPGIISVIISTTLGSSL